MRGNVLVELVSLAPTVGKRVLEMELLFLASGIACIGDASRCHVAIVPSTSRSIMMIKTYSSVHCE